MNPGDLAVVVGYRVVDVWRERPGDLDGLHNTGEKFAIGDHLIFLSEGPGNTARVLHGVLGFCLIHTHFLRPV